MIGVTAGGAAGGAAWEAAPGPAAAIFQARAALGRRGLVLAAAPDSPRPPAAGGRDEAAGRRRAAAWLGSRTVCAAPGHVRGGGVLPRRRAARPGDWRSGGLIHNPAVAAVRRLRHWPARGLKSTLVSVGGGGVACSLTRPGPRRGLGAYGCFLRRRVAQKQTAL